MIVRDRCAAVEFYRDCFVHKSFSMESNNGALSRRHYLVAYDGLPIAISRIIMHIFDVDPFYSLVESSHGIPGNSRCGHLNRRVNRLRKFLDISKIIKIFSVFVENQ